MSSGHPTYDVCDLYANANLYGLGKGIFPKDKVPILPAHPNCMCSLSPVYKGTIEETKLCDRHNEGGQEYIEKLPKHRQKALLGVKGEASYQKDKNSWPKIAHGCSKKMMTSRIFKVGGPEEQYRVAVDKNDSCDFQIKNSVVTAERIIDNHIKMYGSINARLKPLMVKRIKNAYIKALNLLNIPVEDAPLLLLLYENDVGNGYRGGYRRGEGRIAILEAIADKKMIFELQKRFAFPYKVESMLVHELLHWKDEKEARGQTWQQKAIYVEKKAKEELDKIGVNKDNVISISEYAFDMYKMENYSEVYTEYRVKKILGGK